MSLVKKHLWVVVESEEIRKCLVNRKLTVSFSGEAIKPIYPTHQSPGYGSIKLGRMIHFCASEIRNRQPKTNQHKRRDQPERDKPKRRKSIS